MSQPLIENEDFYYDADGFMVLTEKFHLSKGYCCGHGAGIALTNTKVYLNLKRARFFRS